MDKTSRDCDFLDFTQESARLRPERSEPAAGHPAPAALSAQSCGGDAVGLAKFPTVGFAPPRPDSVFPGLRAIFQLSPIETFAPDEALFEQGDEGEFLCVILNGCVRVQRLLRDGRRAITTFLFAGDMLDAFAGMRHEFSAEAVTEVQLRRLPLARLAALRAQTPRLHDELLALGSDHLADAMEHIVTLARTKARDRVAGFLVGFADRSAQKPGAAQVVDLPMNRLDIADCLGLTIESVSRALTGLRTQGLISTPTTHRVVMHDVAALRRLAEGDGQARKPARQTCVLTDAKPLGANAFANA
jgi:CRP/FNR family transcriptional regulator